MFTTMAHEHCKNVRRRCKRKKVSLAKLPDFHTRIHLRFLLLRGIIQNDILRIVENMIFQE